MPPAIDSLARGIDATQVLAALGIVPSEESGQPCPLCYRSPLRCYDDAALHGDWLYCESCRLAGDPVEFAQRAWGEPLAATLEHLARMGIALQQPSAEQVEKYQRDHLDHRQQLERIWDDSRTYHTKDVPRAARSLFAGLGARGLVRDPYWLARIRPFLGLSDRQQLDDLFFPGAFAGRRRQNHDGRSSYRRGSGPGERRMFQGRGWQSLVMLAHYDLPGRIAALSLVGRNADHRPATLSFARHAT